MSATAAAITMIIVAIVYVGVIFLSRHYNHGGRDPVDPLYSVSQWNPTGWKITSSCRVPPSPGFCVIEGLTGAYQDGTRWCNLTDRPCIDPDTGENVKGTAIPFVASCPSIPFCNWSQCKITFDANLTVGAYLKVSSVTQKTLINVDIDNASLFYMQRLSVGDKGLQNDQNGTIAQFFYIPEDQQNTNLYILCYNNSSGSTVLAIQPYNQGTFNLPTMFVLMETMSTTISSTPDKSPQTNFVARKILAFSGAERTQNPTLNVLAAFNVHNQSALWQAAITYHLICIFYKSDRQNFRGDPPDDYYFTILDNWNHPPSSLTYDIIQDAVESRLHDGAGIVHRPFYNWIG